MYQTEHFQLGVLPNPNPDKCSSPEFQIQLSLMTHFHLVNRTNNIV